MIVIGIFEMMRGARHLGLRKAVVASIALRKAHTFAMRMNARKADHGIYTSKNFENK